MIVFYNIVYNVTITATLCGRNRITTTIMLNYGKFVITYALCHKLHKLMITVQCINPVFLNLSVGVTLDQGSALEGAIATLSCPTSSGLLLNGPIAATCMGNGEWGPDPRMVACLGQCT